MKVNFYPGANKRNQVIDLSSDVFYEEDYEWFDQNYAIISMEYLPNGGDLNLAIYGYLPEYMKPEDERIVLTNMDISDNMKKEKFRELKNSIVKWIEKHEV